MVGYNAFKYRILLVSVLICVFSCAKKTTEKLDKQGKEIEDYISAYYKGYEIPGISVGIVNKEAIIHSFSFGVKSLSTKEAINENSIFHMASLSKPVTATAILQLVDQGKIDLDISITEYLPYFKLDDERYKQITIRDILTHTSGMPDVLDYEWDKPQFDEGAAERYVKSITNNKMIASVGERWRYSNMAFDVLADVIAKVSGVSFEDYVKSNILNPLQMSESSFLVTELDQDLRTKGHIWNLGTTVSEIYPYNRRHAPSSCLNSSIKEMCQWAMANLNKGELNENKILDSVSCKLLFEPQEQINNQRSIGLSWFIEDYKGHKTVSHEGSDLGYRSKLLMLPEDNFAIIIASNFSQTPVNDIAYGIADILLKNEVSSPKIPLTIALGNEISNSGIEKAVQKYYHLSETAIEKYNFEESQLNSLGYRLIRNNRFKEAIEILKINVEKFPKSSNTYDSLAEAYMLDEQSELSIEFYKKAIALDPENTNGIKNLQTLQKQKK